LKENLQVSSSSEAVDLAAMIQEIRAVSSSLSNSDSQLGNRVDAIEGNLSKLITQRGRPGAEFTANDKETAECRAAAEMCHIWHAHRTPKYDPAVYEPSRDEIDEALAAPVRLEQVSAADQP